VIPAETVIARVRRDLTISAIVKAALLAAALALLAWRGLASSGLVDVLVLVLIGGTWLALSYRSAKGSRLAADSQWLIATGEYDAAEQQIEQSLRTFSLFRNAKLLGMHRLAMLRHAQRRWPDVVALCRALLTQRLGGLKGLTKPSRLILAEALLEMDDAAGARDALAGLYEQRLSLAEATTMLAVQVDYLARTGAWPQMMDRIATKVQLAELMPTASAARTQGMLALAAKKTGRQDWASWLRQRVELLADVQELCARRPMLWELWAIDDPVASP
jgi:hypothetical protein